MFKRLSILSVTLLMLLALFCLPAFAEEGPMGDCVLTLRANREGFNDQEFFLPVGEKIPAETLQAATSILKTDTEMVYGWYRDEACTKPWNADSDVLTDNLTLYADWGIKPEQVMQLAYGFYYSRTADRGIAIIKSGSSYWINDVLMYELSTKDAEKHGNQYTLYSVTGKSTLITVTISGDKVTLLRYKEYIYDDLYEPCWAVTCKCQGGWLPANTNYYRYALNGQMAARPGDPVREGYQFAGWYTEPTGGEKFSFFTPMYSNITIYAHWKCKVVLDDNFEGGSTQTIWVDTGSELPDIKPHSYIEDGESQNKHHFIGWLNRNGYVFFTGPVTEPITLYAEWRWEREYQITYENNGHGEKPDFAYGSYGGVIPTPELKDELYFFDCWCYDKDLKKPVGSSDTVKNDIKLYARWLDPWTVHFDTQGYGTAPDDMLIKRNSLIPEPEAPSAEYRTFGGWFTDPERKNQWHFDSDTLQADITLHAGWYTDCIITFATVEGDTIDTKMLPYGEKLEEPTEPAEPGRVFRGWYRDKECTQRWNFAADTVPESALTLYAGWGNEVYVGINPCNGQDASFIPGISGEPVDRSRLPRFTNGDLVIEGYYTDNEYRNLFDMDHDLIPENGLELYIKWTEVPNIAVIPYGNGKVDGSSRSFSVRLQYEDDQLWYWITDDNTLVLAQHSTNEGAEERWEWLSRHTAVPDEGYRFVHWDVCVNGETPQEVTNRRSGIIPEAVLAYGVQFRAVFEEIPPHSHQFTYTAEGNELHAVCINEGCELPETGLSLFLVCKSKLYDGLPCAASLTGDTAIWTDEIGLPQIVYYQADGEKTDPKRNGSAGAGQPPVFSGSYYAEITKNDVAVRQLFTVLISDEPISADPTNVEMPFVGAGEFDFVVVDQLDRTLRFSSSDSSVATIDPQTGHVRPMGPGTAVLTVTAEASYNATASEQTCNVTYTELPITVPEENPGTFTYDGTPQVYLPLNYDEQYAGKVVLSGNTAMDAGEYTAKAETTTGYYFEPAGIDKRTAAYTWVIAPAVPEITIVPEAEPVIAGSTLSESVLTGGKAVLPGGELAIPGTFAFKDGTVILTLADSDSTEFKVRFIPDDANNYTEAECVVKVTVVEAPPELYTVTVTDDGHGTGSADPTCGAADTPVRLTSVPAEGFEFDHWEVVKGDVTVANDQFTIGTADVEIKVYFKPVMLTGISITNPPDKTAYTEGEPFDPAGMVVTAAYSDNSTRVVTDYTVFPDVALSVADSEVTVSYTFGETATAAQAITVAHKNLTEIGLISPTDDEEGSIACLYCTECGKYYADETGVTELDDEARIIPALKSMDVLTLPVSLTRIEQNAFSGTAAEAVIVPWNCKVIESGAFTDCPNLRYVRIPKGTDVATDAFDEGRNIVIDRN